MNEFSPSELIYLYIDGEADAGQQAALFAALAHDSELQAEFSDALAIRMSASAEVRNTTPAPALKNELFQKAGFSVGTAAGAAASSAIVQKSGGAAGWIAGVKSMALPVLAVLSGAAMFATGSWLWYHSSDTTTAHTQAAAPAEIARAAAPAEQQRPDGNSVPFGIAAPPAGQAGTQPHSDAAHPAFAAVPEPEALRSDGATASRDAGRSTDESPAARSAFITQAPARVLQPSVAMSDDIPVETVSGVGDVQSVFPADEGEPLRWEIGVRGIIGLALFPWREMGRASDLLDNTAVGAAWLIDEEHTAGIEIGREILPMYIADGEGELRQRQTLMWGGVRYRFTPVDIQLTDGLQPFASAFAGGSVSGPMFKSVVGLMWKPDSRIQFALGAEGTFLLYRYRQQWYGTQKLGVSYGVTVTFP